MIGPNACDPQKLMALNALGIHTTWLFDCHNDPAVILGNPGFWVPAWRRVRQFDRIFTICRPGTKPGEYRGEACCFEVLITAVTPAYSTGPNREMVPAVVRAEPWSGWWPRDLPARLQASASLEPAAA